jgi:hypothetical protein
VYGAAFAYYICRIIPGAIGAANKTVTFLFIPPTIITAKEGLRYIL